jgi:hypothetical protein
MNTTTTWMNGTLKIGVLSIGQKQKNLWIIMKKISTKKISK